MYNIERLHYLRSMLPKGSILEIAERCRVSTSAVTEVFASGKIGIKTKSVIPTALEIFEETTGEHLFIKSLLTPDARLEIEKLINPK